jgi:hypothetical protein
MMRRHSIGIEEATRALLIRNVFKMEMEATNSQLEALQRLTSKLSLDRILYEHEQSITVTKSKTTTSSSSTTTLVSSEPVASVVCPPDSLKSSSSRHVSSSTASNKNMIVPRTAVLSRKKATGSGTARNKYTKNNNSRKNSNNSSNPIASTATASMNTNILSGRKRSMEELESSPRPRADSVTDQVDAKLMAESSTTTGPRVKRVHRISNNIIHPSTAMNIDCPDEDKEEEEEGVSSTTMNTIQNSNTSGPSC